MGTASLPVKGRKHAGVTSSTTRRRTPLSAGRRASSSSAGTGSASRPRWIVLLDQAEVVREERADRALRGQEEGVLLREDRDMGAAGRRDGATSTRRN